MNKNKKKVSHHYKIAFWVLLGLVVFAAVDSTAQNTIEGKQLAAQASGLNWYGYGDSWGFSSHGTGGVYPGLSGVVEECTLWENQFFVSACSNVPMQVVNETSSSYYLRVIKRPEYESIKVRLQYGEGSTIVPPVIQAEAALSTLEDPVVESDAPDPEPQETPGDLSINHEVQIDFVGQGTEDPHTPGVHIPGYNDILDAKDPV